MTFGLNPSLEDKIAALKSLDNVIKWLEGNESDAANKVRAWLGEMYLNSLEKRYEGKNPISYAGTCEWHTRTIKSIRESNFITDEEYEKGSPGVPESHFSANENEFSSVDDHLDAKYLLDEINVWRDKVLREEGFDLIGAIYMQLEDGFYREKVSRRLRTIVEKFELEDLIEPLKKPGVLFSLDKLSWEIYYVSFIYDYPPSFFKKRDGEKPKDNHKKSSFFIAGTAPKKPVNELAG